MVNRNSGFLESQATSLDMAKAFRPRRHLREEAFAESALIIISKTPALKKLGTWELVADALQKTPLGPVTGLGRFCLASASLKDLYYCLLD